MRPMMMGSRSRWTQLDPLAAPTRARTFDLSQRPALQMAIVPWRVRYPGPNRASIILLSGMIPATKARPLASLWFGRKFLDMP